VSADPEVPPLVRIRSERFTGDILGSERLHARLDAYGLQDAGLDTYDANLALGYSEDGRDYTVAAQMLGDLGLDRVALLSNNQDKAAQLDRLGVTSRSGCRPRCASTRSTLATGPRRPTEAHTLDLPCDDLHRRRGVVHGLPVDF
jgi:GTP cyclohydrolase II